MNSSSVTRYSTTHPSSMASGALDQLEDAERPAASRSSSAQRRSKVADALQQPQQPECAARQRRDYDSDQGVDSEGPSLRKHRNTVAPPERSITRQADCERRDRGDGTQLDVVSASSTSTAAARPPLAQPSVRTAGGRCVR